MKKTVLFILRLLIACAALGFLAMFVFPMLSNIINIGNVSGALLCLWVLCVDIKPIHRGIRRATNRYGFTKFLRRFVNVCFIAFAAYGAIATTAMTVAALQPPAEGATAVVLGAQVRPTGDPSVILRGRINAAERYLDENPGVPMILSGGQGADEPMTEAKCMYEVITFEKGEGARLFLEERSTTTAENFQYSNQLIKGNGLSGSLAVVTDGFHQLRARIIAHQLGMDGSIGAVNSDTPFIYLPTYAVREWFGIPYQLFVRPAA